MRLLGRVLLWAVLIVVGLVVLLALSVPADALLGRGRVAALTNTGIAGPAGEIRAYVARPAGPGPHPAVIMIHEFWGLRDDMVGKAAALAEEGYVVIAPDTFRGASTGWVPRAIYQTVTTPPEQVAADLDAVYTWLAAQPDVLADRIAIMGFCYGGRTALLYSLHNPAIAATAIFYGMADTTPAQLSTLGGPVLGIWGGADNSISLDEVRALEANLAAAGVAHTFTVYDGQPHAFVTSIEAIRQGGPQGEAWAELLAFLEGALKGGAAPSGGAPAYPAGAPATILGAMHHRFVCGV